MNHSIIDEKFPNICVVVRKPKIHNILIIIINQKFPKILILVQS